MKNKNCGNVDLVNSEILRNSTETVVGQLHLLREMYKSGGFNKRRIYESKKKVLESE